MKRKAQRCGCCGEAGHNIRTCAIARLPFEQQWEALIELDCYRDHRVVEWIAPNAVAAKGALKLLMRKAAL